MTRPYADKKEGRRNIMDAIAITDRLCEALLYNASRGATTVC